MTDKNLDDLFAQLLKESEDFKRRGGRIAKSSGKPTLAPLAKPNGKPSSPSGVDAIAAIDAAIAKRQADLTKLRKGETPEGWVKSHLEATVLNSTCECCSARTTALSPPQVFLVQHAKRRPDTRHLIPVSRTEILFYQSLGLNLRIRVEDTTLPFCPLCIEDTLCLPSTSSDPIPSSLGASPPPAWLMSADVSGQSQDGLPPGIYTIAPSSPTN